MSREMPLPKYHQVYLVLREQLQEGRFAQGLPGELALTQQFGVGRVTVRRALEQLAQEGLIAGDAAVQEELAAQIDVDKSSLARSLLGTASLVIFHGELCQRRRLRLQGPQALACANTSRRVASDILANVEVNRLHQLHNLIP